MSLICLLQRLMCLILLSLLEMMLQLRQSIYRHHLLYSGFALYVVCTMFRRKNILISVNHLLRDYLNCSKLAFSTLNFALMPLMEPFTKNSKDRHIIILLFY